MKKQRIILFAFTVMFLFSVSSLVAQNATISDSTSVLGKIWNKISGNISFSQQNMVGKWDFKSTACKFETENLLKKAGGAIVATQVESAFNDYCEKFGIKEGTCWYDFRSDSTYSAKIGAVKLSGKFILDTDTKVVNMSYAFGVGKMTAQVVKSSNSMKLYFDADGFLKMMKTLSMFTNNNKVEILAKMSELYDGMLLGFDLDREK